MSHQDHPVDRVMWVPLEKVRANSYNPNSVATNEMRLLYLSIKEDGYTQPVVTYRDPDSDTYEIVDGFHRYLILKRYKDIFDSTDGMVPIVVIDKPLVNRMASTVRHNRARGKHAIAGMGNMVFRLLDAGWPDARICKELGMEPEELARMKHVTGFSKLFEGIEYRQAWKTKRQLLLEKEYRSGKGHPEDDGSGPDQALLAESQEQPGVG